jgi:nicotinate-nucleotide adenylyltransferase
LATRAAEALGLDRVLFVPAARSPLKDGRNLASAADRWRMLKLALRGHPVFRACDLELRRGGVSYTIDTLRQLARRHRARLYLLLGADAAGLLPRWKSIEEVKKLARFAFLGRPGHSLGPKLPKHDRVEGPLVEISSSDIRERRRRGQPVRYWVPDLVDRYIQKKGLYC